MKYLGRPFFYAIAYIVYFLWHLNFKTAHKEAVDTLSMVSSKDEYADPPGGSF